MSLPLQTEFIVTDVRGGGADSGSSEEDLAIGRILQIVTLASSKLYI